VKQATKSRKSQEYYVDGILQGNRVVLAQAITLVESSLPSDQDLASQVLEKTIQKSGNSIRIGITGSPGVGKSTFIEAFGKFLTGLGKKVAVLTVDPTSQKTKGSILGDKTRMPQLATNPDAFIRPSSAGETLGGVANNTREAILLSEAAGFDIIIVETVGVGQSEVAVRNMTDFFLLLMLPGSGDELQGIKKGIMEMADLLVITKADGENLPRAKRSQAEFQQAVHTLYDKGGAWIPKVLTASALLSKGLDEIHDSMSKFVSTKKQSGDFARNRALQDIAHMHDHFQQRLKDEINNSSFLQGKFTGEAGKKLLGYFQEYIQTIAPVNK
jgi:LAO/AO transport system kinase